MQFFARALIAFVASLLPVTSAAAAVERPNILVILTDDQGYGDLGCYGSTKIRTPRLDRLAREGTRFTSFYSQPVCGPARSALLTGREPVRSGGWSMPASEVTIAELLHGAGYATACFGKWDVSNRAAIPARLPTGQGFATFFGSLGGTDTGRLEYYDQTTPAGFTDDMGSVTRTLTDKAIAFLRTPRDQPFFLYLAHPMLHSVIDASPEFRGKSPGGLYGDVVEELDFHTGRLLDVLDELRLRENTLVIFTSDNGTWSNNRDKLRPRHQGAVAWGSSGPLREAKGSSYEGGSRVPCLVRWPGHVPAGRVSDALFASLDFLPTFGKLAGYEAPRDRPIDGVDQSGLLLGRSERGAREHFFYFSKNELHAVRQGRWKLRLPDRTVFYDYVKDRGTSAAELYDLDADIGETNNLAAAHPAVVERLTALTQSFVWPEKLFEPYSSFPDAPPAAKPAKRKLAK
jgi:arylsulfatase A-like enzyme